MRTMGIFHPDWSYHSRPVVNSAMLAVVEVSAPTGNPAEWTSEGFSGASYELVYRGPARVQPNLDWRARDREFAGELTGTQAVRIQIPFGGNELGADYLDIAKDYRVEVIETPVQGTEYLLNYIFTVRNALNSSNAWLINMLCDAATKANG